MLLRPNTLMKYHDTELTLKHKTQLLKDLEGKMFRRKNVHWVVTIFYVAYHEASKVVRSIPRCNMALNRKVRGNGTLAMEWKKGSSQRKQHCCKANRKQMASKFYNGVQNKLVKRHRNTQLVDDHCQFLSVPKQAPWCKAMQSSHKFIQTYTQSHLEKSVHFYVQILLPSIFLWNTGFSLLTRRLSFISIYIHIHAKHLRFLVPTFPRSNKR